MNKKHDIHIRKAKPEDMGQVHQFVKDLALYERAEEQVVTDVDDLVRDGFGEKSFFKVLIAELASGKICGFALFYPYYSTWKGMSMYLEDLYVDESARGSGAGQALFEGVLQAARDAGAAQLKWQVLDWNTPAINFYKKIGASLDETWINGNIQLRQS